MTNESGFKRVARDVSDLFELQMQLFAVDSQEAMRRLVKGVILLGAACIVALSALTTLVLAAGWGIHEGTEWPLSLSMLTAAAIALALGGLAGLLGFLGVRKALSLLNEPKRELTENLRWLKATLLAPSTSPRNQLRSESFHHRFQAAAER